MPRAIAIIVFTAAAMLSASLLHAQAPYESSLTAQPNTYDVMGRAFDIKGWGPARFGMTMAEIRTIIATTFPNDIGSLKSIEGTASQKPAFAIVVPRLAPGPGAATISYVFGANSRRLIAVNIYWLAPGVADRSMQAAMVAGGADLASGLEGYRWPFSAARGRVVAPGVLVVFAGRDAVGNGVEVRLNGVEYDVAEQVSASGTVIPRRHQSLPAGPAQLRISFVAHEIKPSD